MENKLKQIVKHLDLRISFCLKQINLKDKKINEFCFYKSIIDNESDEYIETEINDSYKIYVDYLIDLHKSKQDFYKNKNESIIVYNDYEDLLTKVLIDYEINEEFKKEILNSLVIIQYNKINVKSISTIKSSNFVIDSNNKHNITRIISCYFESLSENQIPNQRVFILKTNENFTEFCMSDNPDNIRTFIFCPLYNNKLSFEKFLKSISETERFNFANLKLDLLIKFSELFSTIPNFNHNLDIDNGNIFDSLPEYYHVILKKNNSKENNSQKFSYLNLSNDLLKEKVNNDKEIEELVTFSKTNEFELAYLDSEKLKVCISTNKNLVITCLFLLGTYSKTKNDMKLLSIIDRYFNILKDGIQEKSPYLTKFKFKIDKNLSIENINHDENKIVTPLYDSKKPLEFNYNTILNLIYSLSNINCKYNYYESIQNKNQISHKNLLKNFDELEKIFVEHSNIVKALCKKYSSEISSLILSESQIISEENNKINLYTDSNIKSLLFKFQSLVDEKVMGLVKEFEDKLNDENFLFIKQIETKLLVNLNFSNEDILWFTSYLLNDPEFENELNDFEILNLNNEIIETKITSELRLSEKIDITDSVYLNNINSSKIDRNNETYIFEEKESVKLSLNENKQYSSLGNHKIFNVSKRLLNSDKKFTNTLISFTIQGGILRIIFTRALLGSIGGPVGIIVGACLGVVNVLSYTFSSHYSCKKKYKEIFNQCIDCIIQFSNVIIENLYSCGDLGIKLKRKRLDILKEIVNDYK